MSEDVRVVVQNVGKLQSALKKVDANTGKQLKEGFRQIAERVANSARDRVPRKSGRAAASVKARGSQRGGAIAFGGSAAPHYPWLDFGGSTGHRHKQGVAWSGATKRPWLGNPGGEGRYVYPAIRDHNKDIMDSVDELLARVIRDADFDTRES